MSDEWQAYFEDPRTVCKYASNCYQKNPEHHKKFKHPPADSKRKGGHKSPPGKRFKPSPRRVHSPVNKEDTGNDNNGETSSVDDKIAPNLSADSNLNTEPSSSNKDESNTIKLPETISYHDKDDHTLLKELFLVEMPADFFKFYEFLQEDQNYVKTLSTVNLELIGPFDLLTGKLPALEDKELYLIHWRFFYDPPEFQAVLKKKGKSEYHIGYFRDEPNSEPVFLAHNDSGKSCQITPMAKNIFGAVYLYLQNEKKSSPFTSVACQRLMEKVKKWADTHSFSIQEYNVKERLARSVTKSFHGAGIVVPFNKKTELGYRKLVETDANLKKLFTKLEHAKTQSEKDKILSELQPVITYASIAVDECDFGTGLECGINLFCSGIRDLQRSALGSLQAVYSLLNREAFGKIIKAHIKYRRKGPNMSVLSVSESSTNIMGFLNVLYSVLLGVTLAVKQGNETSLRVLEPELQLSKPLNLTCGVMKEDLHEEDSHPLARASWVIIAGDKEKQLDATRRNKLELILDEKMNGAYVTCRSHARSQRHLVVLATPPLQLRIANAPPYTHPLAYVREIARVGQTRGGPLNTRAGESIEVVCESLNQPKDNVIYKYILQRNDIGDVEKEIEAAIANDTRGWCLSARLKVTAEDHNSRVYCLARWFKRAHYREPTAVRSEPIVLIVEPPDCGYIYLYVWVAVGVGILGWLVAVTSLWILCLRKRSELGHESSDSLTVLNDTSSGFGCLSINRSSGPRGATILPAENAHSLAAANIKLTPQSTPAVQRDTVLYSNIEELNALARRRHVH